MNLSDKIANSIELIRRGERLALALNPTDGYYVGFSGGKDSQVLLDLVKRAGVQYRAYYSVTTNDPPENVYFIRQHYPDVEFVHHNPNLYSLISTKGMPTIFHRWCCEIFKENCGKNNVVLTGVRRDESKRRAQYMPVEVRSHRREHRDRTEPYTIEGIEAANHQCISGDDKIMIYPILQWTITDIWVYIAKNRLPVNPCYETGGRVGCMFCPYASKEQIEYYEQTQPKAFELLMKNLERFLSNGRAHGINDILTVHDYYEWWKSGRPIKELIARRMQTKIDFDS